MAGPRTQGHQGGARFSCQSCHRTYSKAEHLQRHERTHTGVRPFPCPICGRQFSRLDSLTRHKRTHARNAVPNSQVTRTPTSDTSISYGTLNDQHHQTDETLPVQPIGAESATTIGSFEDADFDQLNMALEWPDSETLLQNIVSFDLSSLTLPPGSMFSRETIYVEADLVESSTHLSPPNGSHEAIQSLSDMVTSLSENVTSAVKESSGVTSLFLDNCLQSYFAHFNAHFPILHRPTFVFQDCSPSLILNAIALGSLYIGTDDAVAKGEVLWRLAHTAVATSWQALIRYQGPYDSRPGVQLILTALLGQCYAMMSKNTSLRLTSQVFHSLGFNWANQCNLFSISPIQSRSEASDPAHEWRVWAAGEVHRRALIGHYILDGQLAYLSGQPTCTTHATNPLSLSTRSQVFEASSSEAWHETISNNRKSKEATFRQVYMILFSGKDCDTESSQFLDSIRCPLDIRVILECLHALVRENRASNFQESIVTIPTVSQVKTVLARVYYLLQDTWPLDDTQRLELTLRWHFICIDTLCDTIELSDQVCRHFRMHQFIFKSRHSGKTLSEILRWTGETVDAKQVFLHASAVQDIVSQLPMNRIQSFWMPFPLFTTSIIYTIFQWSDFLSISVPTEVHWPLSLATSCVDAGGEDSRLGQAQRYTSHFLTSDLKVPSHMLGPPRNLAFELKRLRASLHSLTIQWGVSIAMEEILGQFQIASPIPGKDSN